MMRKLPFQLAAASIALAAASGVHAAAISITNPGFDATNNATGNPIVAPSYTAGFGAAAPLGDSNTGAFYGTATVNGYTSTSSAGVVYADATEYSQGTPTGPGGYVSIGAGSAATESISQTLTGTSLAPFTKYTLTVTAFDRRYGAGDNVSFPSSIDLAFTAGGVALTGAVQTGSAPVAGGMTTYMLAYTTGATAPTGDLGFSLGANGYAGLAASQVVFDNVAIDATATPEPATLGMLGLSALITLRRRRRSV